VERQLASVEAYGYSELALGGFLRVVTHPRVFRTPTPLGQALELVSTIREQPNAVAVAPGPRHWEIFERLCRDVGARGNIVPDAYFAALAIEHGCEWVTLDRDYARFKDLRWRSP
jgi:toxin-antitoxin system PIN domain toxin